MAFLRRVVGPVRASLQPLLVMNLVYFGLVGAGMVYGGWHAEAHDSVRESLKRQVPEALPAVWNAYTGGHFAMAVALTFVVNLLVGSLACISLPSLVVPFSGLLLGVVRAVSWGVIFSPRFAAVSSAGLLSGALIGLLIMLEGEGYVLAMCGAYVHGHAVVQPARVGAATRWQGYKTGATHLFSFYPLIAIVLAVAAVYEATIAIYLLPALK